MKYFIKSSLSENIHTTPEGYLLCMGVPIARTGEMVYGEGETPLETDDEGKVLIQREEKEVFRPSTIASFEGKPVTITHPEEFVTPENWKRLTVGIIQNVRRGTGDEKEDLLADLLITDHVGINLVKNGLREVSCGYEAEYEDAGNGRGFQTKIVGNHLALVEQGRAGSAYAIHDHKGKGVHKMTLKEKLAALFAKTQDEAMKLASDESAPPEKKDDDKDKSKDAGAYDELVKVCNELSQKLEAMKPKDAEGDKEEKPKKDDDKDKSKDDESSGIEDRLKALEASVAKILEAMSDEGEESEDDDMEGEVVGDEDEESEDDDFEESTMTGDTASRAEILAPGIAMSKDVKAKALKKAYDTKEGKKIIESLTGGKAPTFDSKDAVNTLFIAASEVLKATRGEEFSKTKKTTDYHSVIDNHTGVMSAERLNEIHAKHWQSKRN